MEKQKKGGGCCRLYYYLNYLNFLQKRQKQSQSRLVRLFGRDGCESLLGEKRKDWQRSSKISCDSLVYPKTPLVQNTSASSIVPRREGRREP